MPPHTFTLITSRPGKFLLNIAFHYVTVVAGSGGCREMSEMLEREGNEKYDTTKLKKLLCALGGLAIHAFCSLDGSTKSRNSRCCSLTMSSYQGCQSNVGMSGKSVTVFGTPLLRVHIALRSLRYDLVSLRSKSLRSMLGPDFFISLTLSRNNRSGIIRRVIHINYSNTLLQKLIWFLLEFMTEEFRRRKKSTE